MKTFFRTLSKIIFTLLFPLSLISTSLDPRFNNFFFGYFGQHNQAFTYVRYAVLSALLCLFVFLNRRHQPFLSRVIAISLGAIACAVLFESTFTHHWLYNYAYILWTCAAIAVASGAVFLSGTLFIKESYARFFKSFWMSFTTIYLFILFVAFVRNPGSYTMTVNMHPGQGTLHFFQYIIHHPDGLYISLVCVGNILIFLPLSFILYTWFPKMKMPAFILIGLLLPIVVEAYQYIFSCGNVDIDDLILNWSGYLIGYLLLRLITKLKISQDLRLSRRLE